MLSVLRFTDSDYPCGIFKLFFENTDAIWNSQSLVCLFDGVNATFNNISVISWRTVLFVEEIGGPEKTIDLSQVTDKLYFTMLYTTP